MAATTGAARARDGLHPGGAAGGAGPDGFGDSGDRAGIATRASLAGEVSQRKALAARIAEKVLNESIVMSQYQTTQKGTEQAGPYQFWWTMKDEPWSQLATLAVLNSSNGVNQAVVNQDAIHQVTVNVMFKAQNKDYAVHLSTLVNTLVQ